MQPVYKQRGMAREPLLLRRATVCFSLLYKKSICAIMSRAVLKAQVLGYSLPKIENRLCGCSVRPETTGAQPVFGLRIFQ